MLSAQEAMLPDLDETGCAGTGCTQHVFAENDDNKAALNAEGSPLAGNTR